ncbi:MAG: uroporphyrinogen decarboxylase family protein [Bacillota bacterium]|nr:uroporphyrinogen decarboxylase family protein [Bacillota bacterium]
MCDDGLDLEQFWRDDARAHENNAFNDGSLVALGIRMHHECVFDELGIRGHPWETPDPVQMNAWARAYNDRAERIVGRRLLNENLRPREQQFPAIRRIGEVFGSRYVWRHHTEWLERSIMSPAGLEKVLDRVETMDFREFMLPPEWEAEKTRLYEQYGLRPEPLRHVRGPVTLACSVYGAEELIFLLCDAAELAARFARAITHAILEMGRVMDEEAGTPAAAVRGFSFADDNCCLLNPEMYEAFGYPVLRAVFAHYSPDPGDPRYQHSDSDMGHLLPLLGRLDLTGVNFGPNVLVPEIRRYLPRARIDGCIAPFAFSRNDLGELTRQTIRDCCDGLRYGGVNLSTAGSINPGSRLTSLRHIMALVQEHGRR